MGKLRRDIILLGLISFFTDMSSEIIAPILPFFLLSLGGSGIAIGLVMGLGDGLASILNFFSGRASDKIGKRKLFISAGYGLSATSKLFFPFSSSWWNILILRASERAGKGIRGAPRDAMIGERYEENRGLAFGFHRAMDTSGAIVGSLLAFLLFWLFKLQMKTILIMAAFLAFLAIPPVYFLKEKKIDVRKEKIAISSSLKKFIAISILFYLGNFSYVFFLMRAKEIWNSIIPSSAIAISFLLYALFNIVYASLSMHFGKLSDKMGRRYIIVSGYLLFAFVCFGFIFITDIGKVMAGILSIILFILYGMVFAIIEGNQRAYVSDLGKWKGYSQGAFRAYTGIAVIISGLIAGFLWDADHGLVFLYGAALSILSASLLSTVNIEKD